tara:strand:- start:608 stop:2161 length:1554 start_codon:yes stop_codon:yes gene_type:complete
MSKKLTEQTIDEMIKDILKERNVNIAYPDGTRFKQDDLYRALYGKEVRPPNSMTPKDVDRISGLDGNSSDLSDKDFDIKINKHADGTNAKKQAEDWKDDFVKKWRGQQPDLKGFSKDVESSEDGIEYDTEDRFPSVPSLDLDYQALAGDFDEDDKLVSKRSLDATTLAVFKAEIARHGNMIDLFEHYEKLSKVIQQAAKGDQEAKAILKEVPAQELFNSASVMATLTYVMNMYQGASAGTIFEVFLAFLSNGIVFGGSGAAADILAGKNGEVMISAKAYDGSVPSGDQSKANIHAETQLGETIWYVGLAKTNVPGAGASAKNYNQARLFITGINRISDENSPRGFKIINKDGVDTGMKLQNAGGKKKRTHYKIPFQQEPDYELEFATDLDVKMGALNFQALFNQAVDNSNNDVQKAIVNVYKNISKIKQRTQRYLAITERDFSKSFAVVQKAASEYAELKSDLKTSFAGVAKEKGFDSDRQSDIEKEFDKQPVSESNIEKIDDLIAEAIRDMKKNNK